MFYVQHQTATALQGLFVLLKHCCLSNISTILDYRHTVKTINTYKDMYEYFRHHTSTLYQGWSLAAAVLFVKYLNINGFKTYCQYYKDS